MLLPWPKWSMLPLMLQLGAETDLVYRSCWRWRCNRFAVRHTTTRMGSGSADGGATCGSTIAPLMGSHAAAPKHAKANGGLTLANARAAGNANRGTRTHSSHILNDCCVLQLHWPKPSPEWFAAAIDGDSTKLWSRHCSRDRSCIRQQERTGACRPRPLADVGEVAADQAVGLLPVTVTVLLLRLLGATIAVSLP